MINKEVRKRIINYITFRVVLTIIVVIFLYLIKFIEDSLPFTFESIVLIHKQEIIFWLIDALPLIMLAISYFTAKSGHVRESRLLNRISEEKERLEHIHEFAGKLSIGEVNTKFDLEEGDELGSVLVNLRDSLVKNIEDEKARKKEDDQRNWANHGLAMFGEILRKNTDDMTELSYNIVSNLVKYMKANQGGVFIITENEDGEKVFEQTATYAYERRKYKQKIVKWGEGLVGACALEKETIYMTDIPDRYVYITSGLGEATPSDLLLVPLKLNEDIFGVIEIASFLAIEPYQRDFVEKVCESIASTISSVKVNIQTKALLEDSRKQAEALEQKDEEMRQNMEELMATQEEATKQEEKMASFVNAVNHTLIQGEYSLDGKLQYSNSKFYNFLGYNSNSEIQGKEIIDFIFDKDKDWFREIWSELSKGGRHFQGEIKHITQAGKKMWIHATYVCMRTRDGKVEKVLFIGTDITEQKTKNLDFEGQFTAVNLSNIKATFSPEGDSLDCNENFTNTFGYSLEEFNKKNIFDFATLDSRSDLKKTWNAVINGEPYQGRLPFMTKNNEERWFQSTLITTVDMYGKIEKVVVLANDVTEQRQMEIEAKEQAETLKTQEAELRSFTDALKESEVNLNKKLDEARAEMKLQIVEIDKEKQKNIGILEGAVDGVITFNQDGVIEFFNKAAEEIWGYDRSEVLGKNISEIMPLEITATDYGFESYFNEGDDKKLVDVRSEVSITNKENEPIDILLTISNTQLGKDTFFSAFVQNIDIELF